MSIIRQWAAKHGVPLAAVLELEHTLGIGARVAMDEALTPAAAHPDGSEARQQDLVRLEAARLGVRLFRNNSGAYQDKTGRMVRYGLANDSARLNAVIKSPDLVGWRKRVITADDVGSVVGQCVLREMKPKDWQYSGDDHERAQLAFLELAAADGCDARFSTGPGSL